MKLNFIKDIVIRKRKSNTVGGIVEVISFLFYIFFPVLKEKKYDYGQKLEFKL